MEDEKNKELERQEFRNLYGVEFEALGSCFNRVEGTERNLFKLKHVLDQEEEKRKQAIDAGALKAEDRKKKQEEDRQQAELAQQQQDAAARESQAIKA
eukprot:3584766-Heterocapsa_arctica.AAC.1